MGGGYNIKIVTDTPLQQKQALPDDCVKHEFNFSPMCSIQLYVFQTGFKRTLNIPPRSKHSGFETVKIQIPQYSTLSEY